MNFLSPAPRHGLLTRASILLVSALFTGGSLSRLRLGLSPDPSNLIRVMPAKGGNAVRERIVQAVRPT